MFLPQNHNSIQSMGQVSDKSKQRIILQNTCLELLGTVGPGKQGQSEIRAQPRGGERDVATACNEVPWLVSRKEKNSPGKINKTAIKCSAQFSCSVMSDSLRPHGLQPARLLCPWDSLGKNTGVGCRFLLQGICLIQVSNLGSLCYRQILTV